MAARDRPGASASRLGAAIADCGRDARWERAVVLLASSERRRWACHASYGAAVHACGRARRWRHSVALLSHMRRRRLRPSVASLGAALGACAGAAQWPLAQGLLAAMPRDGVTPDEAAFGSVLRACARGSQWERGLQLLSEMQARRVCPNAAVLTSAAAAPASGCSRPRAALHLLSGLARIRARPDVISIRVSLGRCAAAGARAELDAVLALTRRLLAAPGKTEDDRLDLGGLIVAANEMRAHAALDRGTSRLALRRAWARVLRQLDDEAAVPLGRRARELANSARPEDVNDLGAHLTVDALQHAGLCCEASTWPTTARAAAACDLVGDPRYEAHHEESRAGTVVAALMYELAQPRSGWTVWFRS